MAVTATAASFRRHAFRARRHQTAAKHCVLVESRVRFDVRTRLHLVSARPRRISGDAGAREKGRQCWRGRGDAHRPNDMIYAATAFTALIIEDLHVRPSNEVGPQAVIRNAAALSRCGRYPVSGLDQHWTASPDRRLPGRQRSASRAGERWMRHLHRADGRHRNGRLEIIVRFILPRLLSFVTATGPGPQTFVVLPTNAVAVCAGQPSTATCSGVRARARTKDVALRTVGCRRSAVSPASLRQTFVALGARRINELTGDGVEL